MAGCMCGGVIAIYKRCPPPLGWVGGLITSITLVFSRNSSAWPSLASSVHMEVWLGGMFGGVIAIYKRWPLGCVGGLITSITFVFSRNSSA